MEKRLKKSQTKPAHLSRRGFVAAGLTALACSAAPRRAHAADFRYKLGHENPPDHPANLRLLEVAKGVAEESNGRLTVEVFPNNQLGTETQRLAQIRSGALELMATGYNVVANIVPSANLASLPFVFPEYEPLWASLDGDFGQYVRKQAEGLGVHIFDKTWELGFRHVFTSSRPVNSVADLKGMKLRVPEAPIQLAFFRALGASPTPVPVTELYASLQTHLVDGAEQPLMNIEVNKYYEIAKYVSLTHHQPTSWALFASGIAWKRLPPDLQDILSRHLNAGALKERADIIAGDKELTQKLAGRGMTILTPNFEEFRDVVKNTGLYAKWRDMYGPEAFALLEKFSGKLV